MEIEIECKECNGEGAHDIGPICTGLCGWCGGCYDSEDCSSCVGGYVSHEESVDEVLERIRLAVIRLDKEERVRSEDWTIKTLREIAAGFIELDEFVSDGDLPCQWATKELVAAIRKEGGLCLVK